MSLAVVGILAAPAAADDGPPSGIEEVPPVGYGGDLSGEPAQPGDVPKAEPQGEAQGQAQQQGQGQSGEPLKWWQDTERVIDGTEPHANCPSWQQCDQASTEEEKINLREQYRAWWIAKHGNPRYDPDNPTAQPFNAGELSVDQAYQYCAAIGGTRTDCRVPREDEWPFPGDDPRDDPNRHDCPYVGRSPSIPWVDGHPQYQPEHHGPPSAWFSHCPDEPKVPVVTPRQSVPYTGTESPTDGEGLGGPKPPPPPPTAKPDPPETVEGVEEMANRETAGEVTMEEYAAFNQRVKCSGVLQALPEDVPAEVLADMGC